jgi:hypothetical protein
MKLPDGGGFGKLSSPSMVDFVRFFGGRASALLRNSRKEVFPALVDPMIRMLIGVR